MKNQVLLLQILLISLISCSNPKAKQLKTNLYYPSKKFFDENNMVKINLDSTLLNFKKITNEVINMGYADSIIPYAYFQINDTIKNIFLGDISWGYIRSRNMVKIKNDSIYKIETYPLKNTYNILKIHYENNGKDIGFADSPEKAFVVIELDTNANAKNLIKALDHLTNEFDKLNIIHKDSLELKVALTYFSQIPPPPKPPFVEK